MPTTKPAALDLDSFAGFTPEDWRAEDGRVYGPDPHEDGEIMVCDTALDDSALTEYDAANARLIAAAPAMLSECKRLRAENERLREALQLAEATICRLKPPVPYDSTQGTRDVIRAALEPQS